MSNIDTAKIVERIKKLHAKAESCKAMGSLEEAEAFATGVQKMLMEYKLEMSVLHMETDNDEIKIDEEIVDFIDVKGVGYKRHRVGWLERLAKYVSYAYSCDIAIMRGSNMIILIGEEADRQVASFVLTTLARTAHELSLAATRKERYRQWKRGTMANARGYRSSWLAGFVTGVGQQIKDRLDVMKKDVPALDIVLARTNNALAKYMDDRFKKSTGAAKPTRGPNNREGFTQGLEAGRIVNINAKAVAPARAEQQRQLIQGRKALPPGGHK